MFFILATVVALGALAILTYNNLVGSRNQVENAFGTIDVMLKKRYDLIPNLLETVKAYMKHEASMLNGITELRTKAMTPNLSTEEKVDIENKISGMMKGMMVAVENYPDLKSSEQFTHLQRSWNETEEQISAARRAYNAAVTGYNNAIDKFPSSIFASMFGHQRKHVFEIQEAERQNLSAKALFNS